MYKIGNSYDIHQLVDNRKLKLGGVEIPYEKGLWGIAMLTVCCMWLQKSILGALGLGDLRTIYPDTDMKNKDLDSKVIVKRAVVLLKEKGYTVVNIDTTIIAENPKMAPFIDLMRSSISDLLEIDYEAVNVKATTNEKMDAIGQQKGDCSNCNRTN